MTSRLMMSIFATVLAAGVGLEAQAQAPAVQSVPRAGFAFSNTVTVKATIDSIDTDTRTIVITLPDGNWLNLAAGDTVRNLDTFKDGETANVTYSEVVTILNLKQKGPGSIAARRQAAAPGKNVDEESARFTYTVVAVDQAAKKVSLIPPGGGAVRTVNATGAAAQDALKTMKTGDVLIGFATPLLITAITK